MSQLWLNAPMGSEGMHGDMDLARGVASNDPACVAAFFKAYHDGVFQYMLCLTNSVEDAEDLAQDSILNAKKHIRSFRGESGLKTWVHRVAFHTFTHWSRRRRVFGKLSPNLPADGRPFTQIDATQALLAALSQLSPALAQPIVLQEINRFSVDEIARVLDIPSGTVKSRLYSARERLRQILGETTC